MSAAFQDYDDASMGGGLNSSEDEDVIELSQTQVCFGAPCDLATCCVRHPFGLFAPSDRLWLTRGLFAAPRPTHLPSL